MTEGRGPGPSHRPAVCSNSRFCSAPADPGARRQGARSSRVSGCGELSGSDRDCGGGGARTLPLPEPALQARPRHRAPPAAAHPERDLGTGASSPAGGRTGSDVGASPPAGGNSFVPGWGGDRLLDSCSKANPEVAEGHGNR